MCGLVQLSTGTTTTTVAVTVSVSVGFSLAATSGLANLVDSSIYQYGLMFSVCQTVQ